MLDVSSSDLSDVLQDLSQGQPAVLVMALDVTAQKEAEAELAIARLQLLR